MSAMPPSITTEFLQRRRSVVAQNMMEPGPSDEILRTLLAIGARVPDHGKLHPWRFLTFQGEARAEFGDVLAQAFKQTNPQADENEIALERDRFLRAPLVIAVISRAAPHPKIPEWEQVLSAGAACQNILVAAQSLGFAAQWLTEWYAYDPAVDKALGLTGDERVAGYIYIGTAKMPPKERPRPELEEVVSVWRGSSN